MGKMSELALLLDEFREANRRASELAEQCSPAKSRTLTKRQKR